MIIIGNDVDGISNLKASLHHTFDMKDFGSLNYFLGLEVISLDDDIYLSQAKYASDLFARVEIIDSRTESTSLEPNIRFTHMDVTVLDNPTLYRQLFGVLRIFRYIKGTLFHGLHFSVHSSLTLQAYSDAD
ncbi:uncharacterized protein LOC107636085 [Arachis ipaensis]|uniref:uncharacterized protein LOC107636085 n=1 Tax=Arachis ipaensis TaxID=130454 RepID=UPI0007AF9DF5|nr:uncharacterized protein LOC107636085 [Arachis ipaensis]